MNLRIILIAFFFVFSTFASGTHMKFETPETFSHLIVNVKECELEIKESPDRFIYLESRNHEDDIDFRTTSTMRSTD